MTDAIQDYIDHVYGTNDHGTVSLIKRLNEDGYHRFKIREGCLLDDMLYIHPSTLEAYRNGTSNPKWIFVFREEYVGSQSSRYKIVRQRNIKKYMLKVLENENG